DPAIRLHALKIDVQHLLPERMHLHVAQQHLQRIRADLHRQDRGMEGLVLEGVDERIVIELDGLRLGRAAVDDPRRAPRTAQAPARAPALDAAREGGEFLVHGNSSVCGLPALPRAAARSSAVATPRVSRNQALNFGESFELYAERLPDRNCASAPGQAGYSVKSELTDS